MLARAARRVAAFSAPASPLGWRGAAARSFAAEPTLKEVLTAQVPKKQAAMKELKAKYGDKSLGEVTVDQCIGGARGVKCMLWETSLLDTQEGIRFRGHTIPDLQKLLPTYKGPAGEGEPLPEALIWCERASRAPRERRRARARAVHLCRALRRARVVAS